MRRGPGISGTSFMVCSMARVAGLKGPWALRGASSTGDEWR